MKEWIMKISDRKKVIAVNAGLVAVLFSLISLNKEVLRPKFTDPGLLKTLTGCFPNFIAAFLISLALVSAVLLRRLKYGRLIVYAGSLLVFVILMLEEIKPMWGASTSYDIFDILASAVGSVLAVLTYEIIVMIKKR